MKKISGIVILICLSICLFARPVSESAGAKTFTFTDDCQRTVELPVNIKKVAPSGNVATMVMTVIAPEYMTNINSKPTDAMMGYLPECILNLPVTGQLYGGKDSINKEEIIALGADVLIDIGERKKGLEKNLDELQAQIGIPCIFLSGNLQDMGRTFETLGRIIGKENRGKELKNFIDETLQMAQTNSAKIKEEERKTVMFSGGADGLGTNAKGSVQAQVLELVGCRNAIVLDSVVAKGNGNKINMEQLYNFNPDVIVFCEDSYYSKVYEDETWAVLKAVKNKNCYEVPCKPYNWLGNPPSLNMFLGVWYLGNLVYPQYYNYDMNQVADRIYNLFWNCDCKYNL